jgi:hypothetical protein
VWQVKPVAVQSWQSTPPTPHAVAVVPLLQLPPVSQQPVHCGQGAEASILSDDAELALVLRVVVVVARVLAMLDVVLEALVTAARVELPPLAAALALTVNPALEL